MRNLKLLEHRRVQEIDDLCGVQCMTVDNDAGVVYAATVYNITAFDPLTSEVTAVVSLLDKEYLTKDEDGRIIGLQYLADEQAACVATSKGNVLLWHSMTDEVECLGYVDSGLTAMEWSPDMELIIFSTGQESIIMMTREFNPITEKSMHPEDFGEAEFINVGWGKKETQFHGTEGKGAAIKKVEDIKPALKWDDRQPRISWRGDGQYFAISNICQHTGARKIRIWSRECTHQSTSEDVNGCESALSWKPSGSLIASTQRKPNKHDVIFFEKNGLRHGEFTLPFGINDVKVKEMYWNTDSTILCIWLEDLPPEAATNFHPKSYVQLWTVNNYHWYLKQTLNFDASDDHTIATVMWDPEHTFRLHILCKGGLYLQYTWCWITNHSVGTTDEDDVIVAVIDGDKVLVTPMRRMVVPPPMAAYSLQLPCPVNQVIFAPFPNTNDIALLLADGRIAIYKFRQGINSKMKGDVSVVAAGGNGFSVKCSLHENAGIFSSDIQKKGNCPLGLYHFLWIKEQTFLCCGFDSVRRKSVLYKFDITDSEGRESCLKEIELDGVAFSLNSNNDSTKVAVQLNNGTILEYNPVNNIVCPWETSKGRELSFQFPCTQMDICDIGGEEVVLGLTERYRFYVNDIEVASNCTSFAVHNDFLLLSTLSHTCRCICRKTKVEVLPTLSDGKAHPFDESIRRIERGSRIVAVVPDDIKLILQMPRGNIETIHPRGLILSVIRKYLDKLQYSDAFTVMKKHRINMNLIHDHDPDLFLNNVDKFVEEVDSVNHFNIFLTDLQEEDVTVTMYTAAYNRTKPENTDEEKSSKVDTICDAMRLALIKVNKNKYLLSILTAYVKKTTPELDTALQIVKNLRENNEAIEFVSAEEALKYLLFLVDVNELYDVALGTYDYQLVMMVAEKSQKDPKEYIPFLNDLKKLEENYQKFTIDKHLKKYRSALLHITKCGRQHFEECMSLIKEHRLYTDGLKTFSPASSEFKEIATSFGSYLFEKKKYEEAGLIYIKACDWSNALAAFEKCLNWRQMFCMAAHLKYSQEELCDTGRNTAVSLRSNHRYAEAAIVYEQYAKDIEETIVTLIEGSQWEESLRVMSKYSRTDFIETHLISSLDDSYDHIIAKLDKHKTDFEKYKKRLGVVREEKEKAKLEFFESGGNRNEADADLFSDTSSATGDSVDTSRYTVDSQRSAYSKSSGMSRRSQRKAKQKKYKLKEGSAYEDIALVSALADIMKYVDGMKEDVSGILKMLIQFNKDSKAEEMQEKYEKFLKLIEKSVQEIWCDDEDSSTFKPLLGPDTTANSIAQAMRQGRSGDLTEEKDPVLKAPPPMRKDVKWTLSIAEMKGS